MNRSFIYLDSAKRSRKKHAKQSSVSASTKENAESASDDDTEPPSKKRKPNSQDDLDTLIRNQNEELHALRDQINEYVDKDSRVRILKYNKQYVPWDKSRDKREVK